MTPSRALPPRIWSRAGSMARSSFEEAGSLAIVHGPRLLRSERTPSFRFARKRQIAQWHIVEPAPYINPCERDRTPKGRCAQRVRVLGRKRDFDGFTATFHI